MQPNRLLIDEIFQARLLEWVAISSSRGSSWLRDWTWISCNGMQIIYQPSHQGSPDYMGPKYQLHFVTSQGFISEGTSDFSSLADWLSSLHFHMSSLDPSGSYLISFRRPQQRNGARCWSGLESAKEALTELFTWLFLLMLLARPQGKSLVCWPQTVPTTCHGVSSVVLASLSAKSLQWCLLLLHTLESSNVATQSDPKCILSCFLAHILWTKFSALATLNVL